ncbi:hypothetical protein Tco_0340140 [Tanacetum coccineum]
MVRHARTGVNVVDGGVCRFVYANLDDAGVLEVAIVRGGSRLHVPQSMSHVLLSMGLVAQKFDAITFDARGAFSDVTGFTYRGSCAATVQQRPKLELLMIPGSLKVVWVMMVVGLTLLRAGHGLCCDGIGVEQSLVVRRSCDAGGRAVEQKVEGKSHAFLTMPPSFVYMWRSYYSLASPGNTSPNFSDDLSKDLLSSLSISLFHDDPYMKIIQAYDTIPPLQVIITLPTVLPPSLVLSLSPMFDSRDSFPSEKISPPNDTETPISPSLLVESSSPIRSTTPLPDYLFNESIFAKLDNLLWIIRRPLGSKLVLEKLDESDTCYNIHL